jgi:glucose-1-phosphate thymidylyltransferase
LLWTTTSSTDPAYGRKKLGRFSDIDGGTIFAYGVANPADYGVVEFDDQFRAVSLEEKPKSPR